ncbi:hypothetical protein ACFLVZ_02250 [Chloroflexota bacterium]
MTKEIGLINLMDDYPPWYLDTVQSYPWGSESEFGYEIIYRPETIHAEAKVIDEFHVAFMRPFGLPRKQFSFEPTFWRVYWDQPGFKISQIKECDEGLDRVARKNNITVRLNGVVIQPRPMHYIQERIKSNKK